jgi:hypothetical protein
MAMPQTGPSELPPTLRTALANADQVDLSSTSGPESALPIDTESAGRM